MPIPAYEETVELFDLDILRQRGDLAIENGDLAVHDGDLKLSSDRYNAMYRLAQRWRFHAGALGTLCQFVFDAPTRRQQRQAEMEAVMQPQERHPLAFTANPDRLRRYHEINDAMDADAVGMDAYAGTVMVVMGAMLRRYWRDVKGSKADWEGAGPLFADHSFTAVVEAAANNFRHYDEWRRTNPPTVQQEKSQRILRSVLSLGSHPAPSLGRNVCADVAVILARGGGFLGLSKGLFASAKAMG
ncbi:hypothetical protein [Sediminicoccus rosea]|uniref:Uncharacterized protein n=1 Tax=Sediminicoccus rosea TaxID=1225128 RepID=A0ABZ0PLL8_9PROT|nr:hypothetical protein [Sediminicoccus rosea]WPB86604.1 hypothetical protein R9Z33_06930 [Sediminicoccus rosea]